MKHTIRIFAVILAAILTLTLLLSTVGCAGERVPDGAYSSIWADTGEIYTFSGGDVRVTLFIMGNVVENHVGTYRLGEGEITFDFPTDKDGIYTGTFPFSIAEDGSSLTITGVEFRRETLPSETEAP